jgi:hypothetical protein
MNKYHVYYAYRNPGAIGAYRYGSLVVEARFTDEARDKARPDNVEDYLPYFVRSSEDVSTPTILYLRQAAKDVGDQNTVRLTYHMELDNLQLQ